MTDIEVDERAEQQYPDHAPEITSGVQAVREAYIHGYWEGLLQGRSDTGWSRDFDQAMHEQSEGTW